MSTKKTTAKSTNKPIEAAVAAGKDAVEAAVKAGTEVSKNYEQSVAMTKDQVTKASVAMLKGYDEAAVMGKANVDAYVASGTAFAKGFEQLSKEFLGFTQNAWEAQMDMAKEVMGVKSVRDLMDLQADYSRKSVDGLMAESAKLAELSMKVANETVAPIQVRVNETVKHIAKPLAA